MEEHRNPKKVKWWMIAAPVGVVLLVAAIMVLVLWDAIYIRIAPTAVLVEAVGNTLTELVERPAGTPLNAVDGVIDDEGKYTMEMGMTMEYDSYMTIDAGIVARSDMQNSQFLMDLDANISAYDLLSLDLNMGMYADQDNLAANWKQLFGEDYYGIAYDTFGDDARGNPLVYDALGEETVAALEDYFKLYQSQMDMMAQYPDGTTFNEEYARILMDFIGEHKPAVTTEQRQVSDAEQKCYVLAYTITSEELAALVEQFSKVMESDEELQEWLRDYLAYIESVSAEAEVDFEGTWDDVLEVYDELADSIRDLECSYTVCFSLYDKQVVYLRTDTVSEETNASIALTLGENPATSDISLAIIFDGEDNAGSLELTLSTQKDESTVEERLAVVLLDQYDDVDMTLGYAWDRDSGDFTFSMDGTSNGEDMAFQLDLLLREEGEKITLELPDLFAVMIAADPDTASDYEGMHMGLHMAFYPGAEITKPEYINIRELSEESISEMENNLANSFGFGF